MSRELKDAASLIAGSTAALLASACCLGPLVLITLGVSGAWIAHLTALEPYRLWFLGAAVIAMIFAWRRIYRPAERCEPGQICARPGARRLYKTLFWITAALIVLAAAYPYILSALL